MQVSTNDGDTSTTLRDEDGVTQDAGGGMYGLTGSSAGAWVTMYYDMTAYAGKEVLLRFFLQDRFRRGSERLGDRQHQLRRRPGGHHRRHITRPIHDRGWQTVDGDTAELSAPQYYIGEFRNRTGFDRTLLNLYNFSNINQRSELVPYNWGLHLIWRNMAFSDKTSACTPGLGGWMVIDGIPVPDYDPVRGFWRRASRYVTRPSSQAHRLHEPSRPHAARLCRPAAVDDSLKYWY